jgi:hypothetical protein
MDRRNSLKNISALLGVSVLGINASELLLSCKAKVDLPWKPVVFSNEQAAFVAELAETILPKTTTPGAKELAVPQFIDAIVKATFTDKDQEGFKNEIETFMEELKTKAGKSFLELGATEREKALVSYDTSMPRSSMNMWGITLEPNLPAATTYKKLKGMVLWGFYTSEEIGLNNYTPANCIS